MPDRIYITASCNISKGIVYKNEQVLFKTGTTSAGEFLMALYKHFSIDYPKFYKMDNLSKLGLLAAELLLRDSFDKDRYAANEVGIVFANRNSSLDADLNYWQSVKNIPSPALFVYTLPNIVIGEICIRHQFKGENAFFAQQEFDGPFMELYVSDLMYRHHISACICGWVDIIGDEYKAVLYLAEKIEKEGSQLFITENIQNIYELANE